MKRTSSPDGSTNAQKVWYDHAGKPAPDTQPNPLPENATNGLQNLTLFVAWVLCGRITLGSTRPWPEHLMVSNPPAAAAGQQLDKLESDTALHFRHLRVQLIKSA